MKITNHIYTYSNRGKGLVESSATIVILGNNKQIMIDPGSNVKKRLENLIEDMKKDGLDIDKTTEIWLTHNHPDHSQMIYDLSERFGGQKLVRCHPIGKSILGTVNFKQNFIYQEKKAAGPYWKLMVALEDRKKIGSDTFRSTLSMIKEGLSWFWQKITNIEPFFDGEVVRVGQVKVRIIFLPGHVPDEVGFWIIKEKVLILGDLINIYQADDDAADCKLILYNFCSDIDKALHSLKKMKQIKSPKILLTPHSAPVYGRKNIQKIFDKLISKIDSYKIIASDFVSQYPNLKGIRLVKEFANILPDNLLLIEKRFVALAVLKSMGRA